MKLSCLANDFFWVGMFKNLLGNQLKITQDQIQSLGLIQCVDSVWIVDPIPEKIYVCVQKDEANYS